ncbi:MAG TPA: GtrA family protein [Acidobacteriaceae bacterium]|nr:GtrA family protein [Acidobacteriaceae bacterium]
MNPLKRFLRFNLVGILGILVQLTTLAILDRALPHHYLLTSTIAVELTLLHNFLWHLRYTWPETRSPLGALVRFHLSNGLISLFGNIALMHLFVHSLHAPILIANALTIACCGIVNFLLAHHWAFAEGLGKPDQLPPVCNSAQPIT